jgi:hypothetical protein
MITSVEFPAMRDEVVAALRSLADPQHQRTHWGVSEPGVNYYDDLTLNVHILYDDSQVLPDPSAAVGAVLSEGEVDPLRTVHDALGPILDELGDRPDSDYLADTRWPAVVAAAQSALDAMRQSE